MISTLLTLSICFAGKPPARRANVGADDEREMENVT